MLSFLCKRSTGLKRLSNLPLSHFEKRSFFTFVQQYERAVVLTFGRLTSIKEPGIRLFIPAIQDMYRVDLRTRVYELSPQQIITRDNVSASVNAVIYFHVDDPSKAVLEVDDVDQGVTQLGQTELRDQLCQKTFNEILESRGQLSTIIAEKVKERVHKWGVKLEHLQLKNIDLTQENMIRAMAKEAEATRERTAAMIRADGEMQAAKRLTQASKLLKINPIAIELRQLQTLERIAKESNQNTVIIPSNIFKNTNALLSAGIIGQLSDSNKKTLNFDDSDDNQGDSSVKFPQ
eukprot:217232_1